MKRFIFIFCFYVVIFHCYAASNFFEQCLLESGIAKDKSVINMNDPNLKCFDVCIFKKTGILKNKKIDTNAQFNVLKKNYNGSLSSLKDIIELCAMTANQKNDECDTVIAMKKCIMEKIKA